MNPRTIILAVFTALFLIFFLSFIAFFKKLVEVFFIPLGFVKAIFENTEVYTIKRVIAIIALVYLQLLMIYAILWVLQLVFKFTRPLFRFYHNCIFFPFIYLNKKKTKSKIIEKQQFLDQQESNSVKLGSNSGAIYLRNVFRGIFVVGSAGSGKSESIGIPLIYEFSRLKYSGLIYDFKFPTLANEVETSYKDKDIKHYFLDFNNPQNSYRVNPLNPKYLLNTSYAREYATAIINNLMPESIQKLDYWNRSAIDLLTACIWYLREEYPQYCDLPHVLAMIGSNDEKLLYTLQQNRFCANATINIFNALQRGADNQVSGVVGTLQGAVSQINTPELMYLFSDDDFSLDINDPMNPIVLTVGSYPTLTKTFAPLCSLVITVATKLMNQPGKKESFVLLDEFPTVYIPNIEMLPNTGRSNKVATVLMCQDLAQLNDSYGKQKGDILFASCNNHFYGRVSSSLTSEVLSKQFGKTDKTFTSTNRNKKSTDIIQHTQGSSTAVQERDLLKPSEFLKFNVGEFAGILVESNKSPFRTKLKTKERNLIPLENREKEVDFYALYDRTAREVQSILIDKETFENKEINQEKEDYDDFFKPYKEK